MSVHWLDVLSETRILCLGGLCGDDHGRVLSGAGAEPRPHLQRHRVSRPCFCNAQAIHAIFLC